MDSQAPSTRKSLPIFAKCLIILVGASLMIAGALTLNAERGYNDIATFSVDTLAKGLTEVSAEQVGGSLKFKDVAAIQGRLANVTETTGMVKSYVVVDSKGTVVAAFPEDLGEAATAALSSQAVRTIEFEGTVLSDDGFSIAAPIRFGKKNELIGGLAIEWQPDQIFTYIENQRLQNTGLSLALVLVLATAAGFLIRGMVTKPLEQLTERTVAMADGDLGSDVPQHDRGDEIGVTAQAIEHLRKNLDGAEAARLDAAFQRAGFQSSGTPTIICNAELVVTHANRAFRRFARQHIAEFQARCSDFDPEDFLNTAPDIFHAPLTEARQSLAGLEFPHEAEIGFGRMLFDLKLNEVLDENGVASGYVVEYENVTETRKTAAILKALEEAQLRADFDRDGRLLRLNDSFLNALNTGSVPEAEMADIIRNEDGAPPDASLRLDTPSFGKFQVSLLGTELHLEGSLSPVRTKGGTVTGFVLLGTDITRSLSELAAATRETERLNAEQAIVDAALREALTKLSEGDLKFRIETKFGADYDSLRMNFNSAVEALDGAVSAILDSADIILGEADNVSTAADDLSKRTEQQAATLEETAAAISELTTSVASAADGAKNAQEVVTAARENAETSGHVVQEAVDAMGEIETSSDQISRIIGVIDEIAFQTNLLALNAGVEAARAGDAGRGFAVVASEVRALAQRSSDAAHEITDLISTSGEHVKKGVSLVDRAGKALSEIVESVGDIAEHVTSIAVSTQQQSTGLDEINTAMDQLDQVTQRNVAMFEETMAATQTVQSEASTLVGVTSRFECNRVAANSAGKNLAPTFESARHKAATSERSDEEHLEPKDERPPAQLPGTQGNLALTPQEETFQDDNWEEF